MEKVLIDLMPEGLEGKELFKYLKDNHKKIVNQKKMYKTAFDCNFGIVREYYTKELDEKQEVKKIKIAAIPPDAETFSVKVVANTSMWCDMDMDVLLRDSAKKSMRERKGLIPHIHDHMQLFDSEIGEVKAIYYEDVSMEDLGLNKAGTAQALIFETDLSRKDNERAFEKYRTGKVKQHSIGLRYVQLQLAVNEPDDKYYADEYKVWKKYFDDIINKEYVEQKGFFYAVPEYILLENSVVLLGSNRLTPMLMTEAKQATEGQPPIEGTEKQPVNENAFDWKKAVKEPIFDLPKFKLF